MLQTVVRFVYQAKDDELFMEKLRDFIDLAQAQGLIQVMSHDDVTTMKVED